MEVSVVFCSHVGRVRACSMSRRFNGPRGLKSPRHESQLLLTRQPLSSWLSCNIVVVIPKLFFYTPAIVQNIVKVPIPNSCDLPSTGLGLGDSQSGDGLSLTPSAQLHATRRIQGLELAILRRISFRLSPQPPGVAAFRSLENKAGMHNVQNQECDEHREPVQTQLVGFVGQNRVRLGSTAAKFDEAEYDSDLFGLELDACYGPWR